MDRAFLVGCPRSGTTLLQTMLAQHPAVFTVPETHYFLKLRGRFADHDVGPLVSPRSAARALDGAVAAAAPAARPAVPRWWPFFGRYARSFVEVMDAGAAAHGASVWIEKSPIHLHHLDEIAEHVPDVVFLHLLRDGCDVVASFVDLCEREPERWVPQLLTKDDLAPSRRVLIEAAAARWNRDIALSVDCYGRRGHHVLTYESLIADPRTELQAVAAFFGLSYDPAMERNWESAEQVVGHRKDMQHMEKAFQPVEDRRRRRFTTVFSSGEQQRVIDMLTHGGDPRAALSP